MNLFSRMLVAVAGAEMIAGCTDTRSAQQGVVPPSTILRGFAAVIPASVTLSPGDTFRFRVDYSGAVRWRTSNSELADVDSLTGLVRAKATGKVTIAVRILADTNQKEAAAVEIVPRR